MGNNQEKYLLCEYFITSPEHQKVTLSSGFKYFHCEYCQKFGSEIRRDFTTLIK